MRRKIFSIIIAVLFIGSSASVLHAGDESLWTTAVTPDALIILDNSGSMAELPHGSYVTFYRHGSTSCGSSGPFYTTNTGTDCLNTTTLFVSGSCGTAEGPYTTTATSSAPTQDLYVSGTDCSSSNNGPYSLTMGSNQYTGPSTLYISTSSSCRSSYNGPWYNASGTTPANHTKKCTGAADSYLMTSSNSYTAYTSSDCATGPFYRTSGSGHTTACGKYTFCTTPLITSGGYSASDCTTGPFYRASGTGHTTPCLAPSTCTISQSMYTEGDCTSGPFYKNTGTGHTALCSYPCNTACSLSSQSIPWSATVNCSGPFYSSSGTGHTTDCSKLAIAKRALFQLMDANADDSITSTDMDALGMRLGLMRYYNCGSGSYTSSYTNSSSCIKLSWGLSGDDPYTGPITYPTTTATPYSKIYCNNSTSCAPTVTSCSTSSPQKECIVGYSASNYTPLGDALKQGKLYLDWHKSFDDSRTCRQKSIILITDGADTVSCSAGGNTNASQRRAPVYSAKLAKDANYNVYVVGFGAAMPADLKNTLNWTAYYGGTRNPSATQSGTTSAVTVGSNPCSNGTDPGPYSLSGYAFMADNPDELVSSLQSAITSIQEANYSFSSQASVAAARVQEENFIYEASFEPKNSTGVLKEPFWTGHMKKYQIGDNGELIFPFCWDAGVTLKVDDAGDRNMWTYKSGSSLTAFNTSNLTAADLGITGSPSHTVASVVGFYRGESTYNLENWKLGDLFHTNPAIVKTPQQFFFDPRECNNTSFTAFRNNHMRTASSGAQIILVGGNDGQLHAFYTGNSSAGTDCTGGGQEAWSFIPPNLLQKLQTTAHYSHADRASLTASHTFFIDGPLQVFNAWVPSSDSSGVSKSSSDWKTIAVLEEGQGSGYYLWSSSSTCYSNSTSGFSATYSTTYPYYCGLYALDVTNTTATAPAYMWHPMPTSSQAPYFGEAWSKMQVGRVKIGGNEKWVGFIGGGYDSSACLSDDGTTSTACNTPATGSAGKGFFVVDLRDGSIIWSYTHADNANMDFSTPATPLPIDADSDGFIDTVYMGDLGGNMWRFRLCTKDSSCAYCGKTDGYTASPCTSCSTSSWTGSILFSSTNTERGSGLTIPTNTHKQIFTQASATKDPGGNVWVYFGTGENNDPTAKPADTDYTKNRIYAIKDSNFASTYTASQLVNITSAPLIDYTSVHGWYKNLSTNTLTRSDGSQIVSPEGEKMISDMALFNNILYYVSYVPAQGAATACGLSGDAFNGMLNCFYAFGEADAAKAKAAEAAIAAYQAAKAAAAADPGNAAKAAAAAAAAAAAHTAVDSTVNDSNVYVGHGIGSSVLVSYRPGYAAGDLYVTSSGGSGTPELTRKVGEPPMPNNFTNVLYWRDRRL